MWKDKPTEHGRLLFIICPIAIAYSMGQITRNSSEDEIANVNFLYDDIVHALKIQ